MAYCIGFGSTVLCWILIPRNAVYGIDHDLSDGVVCRAQKQRTVIEISSDDDEDGETTPAARARGR